MTIFRCVECSEYQQLTKTDQGLICSSCERAYPSRFGGYDFSTAGRNVENDAQAEIYNGMLGEPSNFSNPHNLTLTHQRGVLLKHVEHHADVLEIGGHRSGVLAFLESDREANCCGVDVSATWVTEQNRLANLRGNGTKWVLGDAENLPHSSESFDIVVSFDVFEHLSSVEKAISEVSRVLRPGGLLVCHMPVADVDWSLDGFQRRFLGDKWRAGQASVGHYHERMSSREDLVGMFEGSGLRVIESESFNVWVQPWHDHKLLPMLGRLRHGGKGVHERQSSEKVDDEGKSSPKGFQAAYSSLALPLFRAVALVDKIGVALNIGGSHSFVVKKL